MDCSTRKLQQAAEAVTFDGGTTVFMIQNVSTTAAAAPSDSSSPLLNSSMTLILLIVVSTMAFVGIYTAYVHCFSGRCNNSSLPSSAAAAASSSHGNDLDPSNPMIGLNPSTVKSLPLRPYDRAATPPLLEDCPICLSEFVGAECVKMIPYCGHVFHPSCIDTWLESHVSCPLCRSTQLLMLPEEVP